MDCPVKITWKWGITLFLSFISWKIIFDLEIDIWPSIYKNAQTFQAGTHRISIQNKKSVRNIKKNIVYVTKQGYVISSSDNFFSCIKAFAFGGHIVCPCMWFGPAVHED